MTNNTHLPSSWVNWIAENQARGVAEADIAEILAANGLDSRFAQQAVLTGATQPDLPVAAGTAQRLGKLEALMSVTPISGGGASIGSAISTATYSSAGITPRIGRLFCWTG